MVNANPDKAPQSKRQTPVAMKVAIVVVALLAALLIYTAMQPAKFEVVRTATIDAKPKELYAQVVNFRNWEKWSPWKKLDPNAEYLYQGPTSGVGATMYWFGNNEVGTGSAQITSAQENTYVIIRLAFEKPQQSVSVTSLTFQPVGDQTFVTWNMQSESSFLMRLMSIVMRCEKTVGDQFEEGLANLQAVTAEK